ncbi:MAG: hypothetical protein COA49_06230 [Bacteroidetes bacterium]|nr:MAG: hypothetical protein COA49_06230 [Bacteroidota bacterium]
MTEKTPEPKFGSSLKWQSVNVTVQVVLQLGFIAALARLIPTEAFGIMAIALVVVGFVEIFAQVGIGPALIQNPNVTTEHRRTAFVFSLGLGIIFFAGTYFAAPAVAELYNQPLLTEVLRWISLSFIISGAYVVPRSMLIKKMQFKYLFLCSSTAMIFGNLIIGLSLAANGAGIWAYVAALLTQNTLLGIGYWIASPGPVSLKLNKVALREMVGYGGRSTVFNMINYAAGKIDTMVVGVQTTDWTLTGFYDRSAYLMGLPVTVLGKLGDSVLFSGMAMMQSDLERLRRTVLYSVHAVSLFVIPLTVFLILRAKEVTVLLLGSSFLEATPIVTILFSCVALRSFIKIGDATMRATDRLKVGAIIKLGFLFAVGLGSWWAMTSSGGGGEGNVIKVAWAVAFATALQTIAVAAWMVWGMQINFVGLIRRILPGLVLGVAVLIGAYLLIFIPEVKNYSNSLMPEVINAINISIHLATSMIVAAIMIIAYPKIIDGGDDVMRKKLFGKLRNGKLKSRLTI